MLLRYQKRKLKMNPILFSKKSRKNECSLAFKKMKENWMLWSHNHIFDHKVTRLDLRAVDKIVWTMQRLIDIWSARFKYSSQASLLPKHTTNTYIFARRRNFLTSRWIFWTKAFFLSANKTRYLSLGSHFLWTWFAFIFLWLISYLKLRFSADVACYGGSRNFTKNVITRDAIRGEACSAQSKCGFATFNYTSNGNEGKHALFCSMCGGGFCKIYEIQQSQYINIFVSKRTTWQKMLSLSVVTVSLY